MLRSSIGQKRSTFFGSESSSLSKLQVDLIAYRSFPQVSTGCSNPQTEVIQRRIFIPNLKLGTIVFWLSRCRAERIFIYTRHDRAAIEIFFNYDEKDELLYIYTFERTYKCCKLNILSGNFVIIIIFLYFIHAVVGWSKIHSYHELVVIYSYD